VKLESLLRVLVVLACALSSVRAELVLSNYTSLAPLKIMPVGDSITDDCMTNGAWRLFLQGFLETNKVAFTNVGRLQSGGSATFTKRKHEGYCGSVIAYPGVYAVYNYSTTDAYLQKIVRDALAITNNRPDLFLILIGANDIGRGRNPWQVATNHMPGLLSVMFSNAPNAHVFLGKTTTLQDSSLGYSVYATNVPIYNAALQAMVNQRRAQGQKVFLADFFSTVDYGTMFSGDHLHPNPLGLKAIAREWAARIETILVRSNQATLVLIPGGAKWKYNDTGTDPGGNWMQPDYDDSGWSNGVARFGYGDPATATTVSFGPDSTNKFVTTWFRTSFVVPWNVVITNLDLRLARTGGAVAWLNGQEIYRTNMPNGPITFTNLALTAMTGFRSHIYHPSVFPTFYGLTGTNVVAVEVHQNSVTNATLGLDMELIGTGYRLPTPAISAAPSGTNLVVSWPASDGTGFSLQFNTNLFGGEWSRWEGPWQTNGDQIQVRQPLEGTGMFFRLQRP
jgi:lysophospholipase L1-like esterase